MVKFIDGVIRFQNEIFPEKRTLFEALSHGQSPEALFITCSDSRIETAMLTQTDPGDLFISRSAGNIVPPHSTNTGGITATLEYATAVLKVPHIVVCGHTDCGAMKAAWNIDTLADLPHTRQWLSFTRAAVSIVKELAADKPEAEQMQMLQEQNVILQLQHLRTHPTVATRLATGTIKLHGWIYDIRTGGVRAYDEGTGQFIDAQALYKDKSDV